MQEVPSPFRISMMYNFRILLAGLLAFSVASCNGIPLDEEDSQVVTEGGYEELAEDGIASTYQHEDILDGAEGSDFPNVAAENDDETKDVESSKDNTVTKSLAMENKALYSTSVNHVQLLNGVSESPYSTTDKLVEMSFPGRNINDVVMSPIGAATDVVTLGDRLAIGEMAYSNKAGELWLFNNDNRCIRRTYVAGSALSQPLDRRTCRKMRKEMLLMQVDAEEQADYMGQTPYNNPYGANWNALGTNGYQMINGVNNLQNSQYGSSPYGLSNTAYGTGSGYGAGNLSPNVLANSAGVYPNYQSSLPYGQGNTPVIGSSYPTIPGKVGANFYGADGLPYGIPYYGSNGIPNNGASGIPNNGASGIPYNGANGIPYNGANGMTYNGANGIPYNGANGMPYNGATGMPYNSANGIPYNGGNGIPYDGANGMPYNAANGMPYNGGNVMTGNAGTYGTNGANGKPAKSGTNSYNGANGMQENYGNNGYSGANGMQDNYGNNGYNGASGKPSKAGTNNIYNGASGMQENYGNNGYSGASGMQDNYGNNGYNGASGKPGKSGTNNAYNGANGVQDSYGNNGYNGANGMQDSYGNNVYNGANGKPGKASNNAYNNGVNGMQDNGGAQYTSSANKPGDGNIINQKSARKPSSEDLSNWLQ